ncbi:di-N-acetylchitobiase-like [Engraulis encrasicolus]|uniref:di-N-acetylchitobiase-like n=1 Tax=Engraulis encrasicolus TaxID=184585 RepID=UPI002FD634EF
MSAHTLLFTLLYALLIKCDTFPVSDCPCKEPALCQPVQNKTEHEVFVFDVGGKAWNQYDWSKVTTIATFGPYDAELMCYAHSKGVRLVMTGGVSVKDIVDPTNRTTWIKEQVIWAKMHFLDGINLDIEQSIKEESPEYFALTALVNETTAAFHREIPGSQVSFDVPFSPICGGRHYDYKAIADACDLLFVMSYDMHWGIVAGPNSPFNKTLTGYEQYINKNIHPKKLVMGVPWYGYDYPCLNFTQAGVCIIKAGPSVEWQRCYSVMMKQVNSSMSGRIWDKKYLAPYYNYKAAGGQVHQVWYDDPQSISLKAAYVTKLGLRGIGMWQADCLDYSDNPVAQQQTKDMWDALVVARDTVSSGVALEGRGMFRQQEDVFCPEHYEQKRHPPSLFRP